MTEPYTIIRRFLFELVGITSLDKNYLLPVVNLLFALPILFYLNIVKTEKILQFWNKKFSTSVAQEINDLVDEISNFRQFFFHLKDACTLYN